MPRESFDRILQLSPHEQEITLHLASLVDEETPQYQRVQATEGVITEFGHVVFLTLRNLARQSSQNDLELLPYDAGTKPDAHEIEWIHLPDFPTIQRQLMTLRDANGLLPVFQAAEPFIDGLRFYVIGVHSSTAPDVFFLRWYTKKKELSQSRGFGAWFREGQFDQVDSPLFLFDQGIDCIVSSDYLFILSKAKFHQIFRFVEKVEEAGERNLLRIESVVPILNFESFRNSCMSHTQKLYKLNVIASKPYLDRITMDVLEDTISFHGLDIEIEGEGDNRRLVYDDRNRWGILKLLDDDYLESRLTGNLYEANSKRTRVGANI